MASGVVANTRPSARSRVMTPSASNGLWWPCLIPET